MPITVDPNQTPEKYYSEIHEMAASYPKDGVFMQNVKMLAEQYAASNLTCTRENTTFALMHTANIRAAIQILHDQHFFNHSTYEAVLNLVKIQDIILALVEDTQKLGQN